MLYLFYVDTVASNGIRWASLPAWTCPWPTDKALSDSTFFAFIMAIFCFSVMYPCFYLEILECSSTSDALLYRIPLQTDWYHGGPR